MSRFKKEGILRKDATGAVIFDATVTIYLAGTDTLATVYQTKTAQYPLSGSQTTTDSKGRYIYYVDDANYPNYQLFKEVITKTGFDPVTYDDIDIIETVFDHLDVDNNITVGGTVDGRDIAEDGISISVADSKGESAATLDSKSLSTADSKNDSQSMLISTADSKAVSDSVVAVTTIASSATPTPNCDTSDMFTVTALAEAATFGAPTGAPTNGQKLIIRICDDGTARALAWNTVYIARGAALPTATVSYKYLYIGFLYNSVSSKWECVASSQEE